MLSWELCIIHCGWYGGWLDRRVESDPGGEAFCAKPGSLDPSLLSMESH